MSRVECVGEKVRVGELEGDMVERVREADRVWVQHDDGGGSVCMLGGARGRLNRLA